MNATNTPVGALTGVRILDMATVLAAPLGATLCADHGADVVKLELPDGSDALRELQPMKEGVPLWWKVGNRGKKGITLDVRQARGREILLSMLPQFDVLVENFRTGTMARWGLDIETLHKANPRLVVVRLTGFGQSGPDKARPGYARIFEAMSGFTNLTGETGGSPLHSNFPVGDAVAAVFCAFAIASEIARLRGNPGALGREVDLAATEALIRILDPLPVEHEQLGLVRSHEGNRTSYTGPSNMYISCDGVYFSLVASSNAIFKRLCTAIDQAELAANPLFSSNTVRVQHLSQLDNVLSAWFNSHEFEDISNRLKAGGIPFSKIFTIEDVERDPHFQARKVIVQIQDPDYGSIAAPCIVPRIVGQELPLPRSGPGVGEHNAEFYSQLGIDAAELERLRAGKVV